MNFVNYLLNFAQRDIPREVLDLAVSSRQYDVSRHSSLETRVEVALLRPSFLLDMSLITGMEMVIPISDMPYINDQDGVTVLQIPESVLRGRKIINVLSLANNNETKGITANDSHGGFSKVMENNNSWTNASVTTRLELISNNEVLVYENIANLYQMALRVTVELSDNFSEISTKSYPQLAKIATKAIKMMIHTSLRVKIGQGHLYHGHELSVMQDIISDYSGEFEDYYENLNLMKKVVFMSDPVAMNRYVQNMVSNNN